VCKAREVSINLLDLFIIMKKKIAIIGAVLGIFIVCAFFVMFIAEQYGVRWALCVQCHKTKLENIKAGF